MRQNKNSLVNNKGKTSKKKKVENNNSEETGYGFKYKIGFNQSVSTGIIGIEGYCLFGERDETTNAPEALNTLLLSIQSFERALEHAGYQVATKNAPKKNALEDYKIKNVGEDLK